MLALQCPAKVIDDPETSSTITYLRPRLIGRAIMTTPSLSNDPSASNLNKEYMSNTFDPEDIKILSQAFNEACVFLNKRYAIGPSRRREVARIIVIHASRGLRDAHRLALKAIVQV